MDNDDSGPNSQLSFHLDVVSRYILSTIELVPSGCLAPSELYAAIKEKYNVPPSIVVSVLQKLVDEGHIEWVEQKGRYLIKANGRRKSQPEVIDKRSEGFFEKYIGRWFKI